MILFYLSVTFLYLFGLFNLLGIRHNSVLSDILYLAIGLGGFYIVRKIGIQFFRLNSQLFYWIFVGLLLLTYALGLEVKGSKRWIDLYFFNFQASEFFKVFFVIFLADFFSKSRSSINYLRAFVQSLLYLAIPVFIIFKQPDLASALVFFFTYVVMCFFSRIPKKYLLFTLMIGIIMLPLLRGYQTDRIRSFLSPHLNKTTTSYNMTQAIISIGSGTFMGRGLGLGTQSQLYFLPENHTDFAFSSLVEQFGLVGGGVVLALYATAIYVLMRNCLVFYHQNDEEGRFKFYVTLGFLAFFIFQVFVNIGMNLGMLPVAGITLPLISYGGSSLITILIGIAMLPEK